MHAQRLIEIAQELGDLYQDQANHMVIISQLEREIVARQVELAPLDGWPGKNQEQRDIEKGKAFAADEVLGNLEDDLDTFRFETVLIDGDIKALEAERRALEWAIRELTNKMEV